jgi:uncharacterized protein
MRAHAIGAAASAAFAALALLIITALAPAWAAPSFPPLTGRVVDNAHILSAQTQTALTQTLADLQTRTHHQLVVVTIADLQGYDIADYGYQLGRAWGIGGKSENDGVLLIVAPAAHKVRIEVGYGLEPVLTDTLASVILQQRVLPKFKAGDMEGGVIAGADAIAAQLSMDAGDAKKIADQAAPPPAKPGGAPVFLIVLVLFWLASSALRRGRGGGLGAALPWIVLSGMGRGGGGSSWGGGGGGGFSGGGGSFGGGGSSGGW